MYNRLELRLHNTATASRVATQENLRAQCDASKANTTMMQPHMPPIQFASELLAMGLVAVAVKRQLQDHVH